VGGAPMPRMVSERAAAAFAAGAGTTEAPLSPIASSPRAAPTPEPPPISTRNRLPSYDDLAEPVDPTRRARSRWIAGVVFLAVAGLLGATLGRQYLVRLSTGKKSEPAQRDDRTVRFLQEGLRLLDQADYDGAQEQLAKAQALADRDPAVLAALARLETVRADLLWLKLRLLDPTAKDGVQTTTRELTRRAGRARQAVDVAFAVAADDPVVVRSRIDAMRIAGEEGKAREWIAPIAANASDPQNAYVLAALDLSEAAPAFGTVIDRLRAAAVSEHESLRARGALIYALVRAGRVVEAETELAKVTGGEYPHPLADELKSFVSRFSAPLDGGAAAPAASTSASAAASASVGANAGAERPAGAGEGPPTGDFRTRLTQAAQASSRGDLGRATELYQSVVNEQPGNTEALSGLADVARRRGDTATATRLYERVLDANPSYLPALMAVADQKWNAGERKGAVVLYKRVVEQAGPSSDYGQRAQSRIRESESAGAAGATAPSTPAAPKPTATATAAPPSHIDTTDLPGHSRPDIDTSDLPGVKAP
jgi:tetratricopeptide (TPR) repeat protein